MRSICISRFAPHGVKTATNCPPFKTRKLSTWKHWVGPLVPLPFRPPGTIIDASQANNSYFTKIVGIFCQLLQYYLGKTFYSLHLLYDCKDLVLFLIRQNYTRNFFDNITSNNMWSEFGGSVETSLFSKNRKIWVQIID